MKKRTRRKGNRRFIRPVIAILALGTCLIVVAMFRFPPAGISLFFEPDPSGLPVPVAGVTSAHLVDTFGAPRSGGRCHEGIDIFARRGQAVRSTTKGLVVSVGENHLGGRTVSVIGPRYKRHYYAHLDTYGDVKRGQWIEPGHLIGTVGNSGNARSTPPHLHYAIYSFFGVAIDPYPLLQGSER